MTTQKNNVKNLFVRNFLDQYKLLKTLLLVVFTSLTMSWSCGEDNNNGKGKNKGNETDDDSTTELTINNQQAGKRNYPIKNYINTLARNISNQSFRLKNPKGFLKKRKHKNDNYFEVDLFQKGQQGISPTHTKIAIVSRLKLRGFANDANHSKLAAINRVENLNAKEKNLKKKLLKKSKLKKPCIVFVPKEMFDEILVAEDIEAEDLEIDTHYLILYGDVAAGNNKAAPNEHAFTVLSIIYNPGDQTIQLEEISNKKRNSLLKYKSHSKRRKSNKEEEEEEEEEPQEEEKVKSKNT